MVDGVTYKVLRDGDGTRTVLDASGKREGTFNLLKSADGWEAYSEFGALHAIGGEWVQACRRAGVEP